MKKNIPASAMNMLLGANEFLTIDMPLSFTYKHVPCTHTTDIHAQT